MTRFLLLLPLVGAFAAQPLAAQSAATDAALEGYVFDASGASVAAAAVVAESAGTGIRTEAATAENGYYRFPLLPIGQYSVTISRPGFKEFRQEGVTLNVGRKVRVDATLELGDVVETVTVTADASIVDVSRQPAMEEVIGERAVRALPIVSRNLFNLNLLGPGVKGVPSSGFGTTQFSFAGLQRTNWSADGMDNTQRRFGRQIRLVIYTP